MKNCNVADISTHLYDCLLYPCLCLGGDDYGPNIGAVAPDYATCVDMVNLTPHKVVATVYYADDEVQFEKQHIIDPNSQNRFTSRDRVKPGQSFTTVIPVKRITVRGVDPAIGEETFPILVTGVHECITRNILVDKYTGRLYVDGK